MESFYTAVASVLGVGVSLFVPALVWATVIAGLYQMVRDRVREIRHSKAEQHQPAGPGEVTV